MKGIKNRNLRKLGALLLSIIVIAQLILPETNVALATDSDNYNKSVSQENDMSISGTDSFGTMLADELSSEMEAQNNNNGCNIFEVTMEENTAIVSFETRQNAVLIVGIYTEDGNQMVASGITDVMKGETSAFIDIEAELPEYFLIKSFIVDTEDYSPLCTSHESSYYTKEIQDLLSKTTDDFEEDKILNLDEDKTNNFAVYSDVVKFIEFNSDANNVILEDEEIGTYVIKNADSTVTSLKEGDIFSGTKESGEELIIKVKEVKKSGTTVTVISEETSLDEVFDYVKIDADAGVNKAEIDNSSCEEGVIYKGITEWHDEIQTYAFEEEGSVSSALSYELFEKEVGDDVSKGKVSGSVDIKMDNSVKVYIAASYQYVEVKLEYEVKVAVEFDGELNGKIPFGYVGISPVPGLYIDFIPSMVFEASGKFEINGVLKGNIGFIYDSETGGKNISSTPEFETEIQVEGTIFIGLSLEPKVKIISESITIASMETKLGAEVEAVMAKVKEESELLEHTCEKCLNGKMYGKLEIGFEVNPFKLEKLKWKTKYEKKVHIADFYYSFTNNEFGWGDCPYISYVEDNNEEIYFANQTMNLGGSHGGVITENEDLYMWGYNVVGQLGNGNNEDSIIPIKVMEGVKSISLGSVHSSAITNEGDLYIWGGNSSGQLGIENTSYSNQPIKIMENIKSVSLGEYHSGAITEEGDLYMWGSNMYGELGNGTTESSYEPIKIMEGVKSVSLGLGYSGAITEEGDLYMWGDNSSGCLGNGTTESSSVPIKVMEGVKSISLGEMHVGAITKEGVLYMWGYNWVGQLGNGTTQHSNIPVKVMEEINLVSIDGSHTGIITKEGDLYMCGNNQFGQLGNGSIEGYYDTPIKIMEGVKSVGLGDYSSGVVTKEGELYMWGHNTYGALGNGSTEDSNLPIKIMENIRLPQEIIINSTVFKLKTLNIKSVKSSYKEVDIRAISKNTNTISYDSLTPDKEYLFYVIKSDVGEILTSDNLLYIEQGKADVDGELTFTYNLEDSTENKIEKLSSGGKFDTGEVFILQGDVNGDGQIDIKDSALIKRYLVGIDVELDLASADVNGDGEVTIKDSALIKRKLAGWE